MAINRRLIVSVLGLLALSAPGAQALITRGPLPASGQTAPVGDTAPSFSTTFVFNATDSGYFSFDFDDVWTGPNVNTIKYTYSGHLSNGDSISSTTFTANSNASNRFVGFLGVDSNGNSSDIVVPPTKVANIYDTTTDPGLLTPIGYLQADYSSTNAETTTFTIVNTSTFTFDPPIISGIYTLRPDAAPPEVTVVTPEPATMIAALTGGVVLVLYRRSRKPRVAV